MVFQSAQHEHLGGSAARVDEAFLVQQFHSFLVGVSNDDCLPKKVK